jgi:PAS domain S-box-containing protein
MSTEPDGSTGGMGRVASGDAGGAVLASVAALLTSDRQELLWAVLENLSEGVVACDASGTLSFFNRATREFHGMAEEPIGPQEWSERYSLHRADGTLMNVDEVPLVRALRGEIVRDAVMVIAPRNREARTVICSGRRLYDRSGKLLGAVVVMRDITEQIAAERHKADLARERELNHAKDELLATVAHELRNPLTSVLGWAHILKLQLQNEEARSALAAIEGSTRMQAQLIDDLSDVARIASGKLTLNRERLFVQEILESVIAGSRPAAEKKGIAIIAPASYEPAAVEADRVRLQQVFWNLFTNALKFTPSGGTVFVEVQVRHDSADERSRYRSRNQGGLPLAGLRPLRAGDRRKETSRPRSRPVHRAHHHRVARRVDHCGERGRRTGSRILRHVASKRRVAPHPPDRR